MREERWRVALLEQADEWQEKLMIQCASPHEKPAKRVPTFSLKLIDRGEIDFYSDTHQTRERRYNETSFTKSRTEYHTENVMYIVHARAGFLSNVKCVRKCTERNDVDKI